MNNIWEFLIQTATVTLVAGLILFVKYIFTDKLSPRWQYGVWSILAIRILVPIHIARYILIPLAVRVEEWKFMVESGLESAYTGVYQVMDYGVVFPLVSEMPQSITDWIFVIYMAGVIVVLMNYTIQYVRLRKVIRRGEMLSQDMCDKLQAVCEKYELKSCAAVTISGISTAFVCGVVRPVLVLPQGMDVDEKVLLHELLHLKNHDSAQSVGWCILHALHWCNPVMYYVLRQIGNDMEAACDQRVLEHLDGEERREYGGILLSMANEKYARAVGTTSISNGGKNITKRIQAIVRFKKYPKGMGLVSICIIALLGIPTIAGTSMASEMELYDYFPDAEEMPYAMALTRYNRCTTVASAVDVYAKSLFYENGVLRSIVSPLEEQADLLASMEQSVADEGWVSYHLGSEEELAYMRQTNDQCFYVLYNLQRESETSYTGYLMVEVSNYLSEDGVGLLLDEAGQVVNGGSVMIPICIWYSDGWVVEEVAERILLPEVYDLEWDNLVEHGIPHYSEYTAEGEYGVATIRSDICYRIFTYDVGLENIDMDAQFSTGMWYESVSYEYTSEREELADVQYVKLAKVTLDSLDEEYVFAQEGMFAGTMANGASSSGAAVSSKEITPDWNGKINSAQGWSISVDEKTNLPLYIPEAYAVCIWEDGVITEELVLGEE